MPDNYLNHNAQTLFAWFPRDADRAWAETAIAELKRRYPKADHWTAGGEFLGFIDIRIGRKAVGTKRGAPVFYIRQHRANGPVSLLINGIALASETNEELYIDDAPSHAQINTWLDALKLDEEGHRRLEGTGRSPVDYPVVVSPGVEDTVADGTKPAPDGVVATRQALNRILYGPPGTGKTYRTMSEALSIIEGTSKPEGGFDAQKLRFDALRREGRIAFVTFHQSFSYEDFIEGIRAEAVNGQLSYKVKDGIFKRLAISAMYQAAAPRGLDGGLDFEYLYDAFVKSVEVSLPYPVKSATGSELQIVSANDSGNFRVTHPGKTLQHPATRKRLKVLYEAYPNQSALLKMSSVINAINSVSSGGNATVYWAVLNRLLAFKEEVQGELESSPGDVVLADEEPEYEQIKRRVLAGDTLAPNDKKYVLIIDEINRGNMSRIFGELITLIEPSKRAGQPETAEVQLPYSNERFSVPNNLYVIGTMNTADRSLAVVDTALRRRFDFIEMMPTPLVLATKVVEGVDIAQMLTAINLRIEHLYDREHMVGHSFFMSLSDESSIADLAVIFRNNVLPLLEEYFYEDWDKISKVLGKSGIYKSQAAADLGFTHAAITWRRVDDKLEVAATYQAIYQQVAVPPVADVAGGNA